jgi:GT2 family glycosyltransferase
MSSGIAALLTCYNRKAVTLAALARLFAQSAAEEVTVFLVDDNSPDGSGEAVRAQFPQVRLLHGDGNLFWCGGMRRAFAAALEEDFDFYLWLNDDTMLEPGALDRMMNAYQWVAGRGDGKAIIAGSTRDPQSGRQTYGGLVRASRIHPFKYRMVEPGSEPLPCLTMNGNCVLIPRCVAERVQNLSAEFSHGIGDLDYGLRARQAGCSVWIAPGYIGSCAWNAPRGNFLDEKLPLRQRWRQMMTTKGLPPGEHMEYARRHGGPLWPVFWLLPYLRVVLGSLRIGRGVHPA